VNRQLRRGRWLASIVSLALLVVGCSASATGSASVPATAASTSVATSIGPLSPQPSASGIPGPSASPSGASPAATPGGSTPAPRELPRGLERDAIAEVVVDGGVRVRSRPSVDAESIKYEPLLRRGDAVFIVDGPVRADGYDWYMVQSLPGGTELDVDGGPFGWVAAASRDGEAWVEDRAQTPCPKLPDEGRDVVGALPEEVLVHCFGGTEIAFDVEANVHCEGPNAFDPAWLAVGCGAIAGDSCGTCGIPIAGAPSAGIVLPREELATWSMRGHFDDPAAASCQMNATAGLGDPSPELVVHRCRTIFVVTSLAKR
jgi:hypothetical protein